MGTVGFMGLLSVDSGGGGLVPRVKPFSGFCGYDETAWAISTELL
jgi:hypothetical protein